VPASLRRPGSLRLKLTLQFKSTAQGTFVAAWKTEGKIAEEITNNRQLKLEFVRGAIVAAEISRIESYDRRGEIRRLPARGGALFGPPLNFATSRGVGGETVEDVGRTAMS
jgi:hypothetical protein